MLDSSEAYGIDVVRNYYKITNKVVSLGGVICLNKNDLRSEYSLCKPDMHIKLKKQNYEEIRSMEEVSNMCAL